MTAAHFGALLAITGFASFSLAIVASLAVIAWFERRT